MGSTKVAGFEPHTEFVKWLVDWVELDWDEDLASGDDLIDRQHKELFELSGRLVAAREGSMAPDEVRAALAALREHAVAHFVAEEAILLQHAVPGTERHVASHDEFRKLMERCELHAGDTQGDTLVRLLDELEEWIRGHVRNEDREALAFLRGAV